MLLLHVDVVLFGVDVMSFRLLKLFDVDDVIDVKRWMMDVILYLFNENYTW